jgi:signal transduction histidine kinase
MAPATKTRTRRPSHAEQVAKLRGEVESLRDQLRRTQRLATLGTMTAMVAHEFNNILTPIISYAQLARENPALVDKAIARAADGGRRATDICGAILGLTGAGVQEPRQESLAELIETTMAAMGREPAKDGIELTMAVPADLTLTTRRVELQQIVLNLLLNAREALLARRPPRLLTIQGQRSDSKVTLTVTDNGQGIAPADQKRIFEPFFSTKDSPDGAGGHGLGLALCRELATRLHGEIAVASTPGEATTFTVTLPA